MVDLSGYWMRQKAILESGGEQSRAAAMNLLHQLREQTGDDEKPYEIIQELIDHFKKNDRLAFALLGTLADAGLIQCLIGELEAF